MIKILKIFKISSCEKFQNEVNLQFIYSLIKKFNIINKKSIISLTINYK